MNDTLASSAEDLTLIWAHRGSHRPGLRRASTLNHWVLGLSLEGRCIYSDPHNRHAVLDPGQIILIRATVPQDWRVQPPQSWVCLAFIFTPGPQWTRRLNHPDTIAGHVLLTPSTAALRKIRPALDASVQHYRSTSIHRLPLARCAFETALLHLHETLGSHAPPQDPRLHNALQFIQARLNTPITVADIARAAACSPSQLNSLFRNQLGQSIHAHLHHARMTRAAHLLTHSTLSIKEIADEIGFDNPKYFMNCFKRAHQMTATRYRQARKAI
jgi:AraC-like DNA-binding protein